MKRFLFIVSLVAGSLALAALGGANHSSDGTRPELAYGTPTADFVESDGFTFASYGPAGTAWVLYSLDPDKVGNQPRQPFREAKDVPAEFRPRLKFFNEWNAAHPDDPIQKGHLFPARAAAYSEASEHACFEARNVLPQAAALNMGPWKDVETHEVELRDQGCTVTVCCGPLWAPAGDEESFTVEMVGLIPRPPGCWKSILVDDGGTVRAESWIFPNRNKDLPTPDKARVSVDEIERRARLNLWPGLSDEREDALEAAR